MGGNDDDIIEHHVEEEVEKGEKGETRSRAASPSVLESVSPSHGAGHSGTQSSHRLLAYSDALISIIATVMVRRSPSPPSWTRTGTSEVLLPDDDVTFRQLRIGFAS